jgi:RNA polymerase sigma factor (sigma-70 family)
VPGRLKRRQPPEDDCEAEVDVGPRRIDSELDAKGPAERELALELALRQDVYRVADQLFDQPILGFRTGSTHRANKRGMGMVCAAIRWGDPSGRAPVRTDLTHLSDEAVVALVARQDEEAFAELYDRLGRSAYGLALRILRDESLAEDAVQEAFLVVWRTAARFVPERAKASTWVLTLVHRRAVDLVRRQERRRAEPLEAAPHVGTDAADEQAWLRLRRERVQTALSRLPDPQREAIELAYYGGFTQSELADRLGQPLGTIKSRMFTGLARLRELLQEEEQDEEPWRVKRSTT